MTDKAYEFINYDGRPIPEHIMKMLMGRLPSLELMKETIEKAYGMGFYQGQRDIIEKAAAITKMTEDEEPILPQFG